jgi:two-component system, sensor histidine kinase and response regulator
MERVSSLFVNLSLRSKLRLITACITIAVVFVVGGGLILEEIRTFRQEVSADLRSTADVISHAVQQLPRDQDTKSLTLLLESLKPKKNITEAHLVSRDGKVIASFIAGNGAVNSQSLAPMSERLKFSASSVEIMRGIPEGAEIIGFVYLKSDMGKLHDRLMRYYQVGVIILLVALMIATMLANLFQRILSGPIMRLSSAARHIAHTRRYDMRVPKAGGDEIGILVEAFNDMVAQTQQQTAELSKSNQTQEKLITELRKAKEASETAHEAKSQFLARISHEIRTPVNGVLGMVDLLLDSPLTEQQKRLATTVQHSGMTLLQILNELLDYAKIEANKIELEIVPYDLPDLADGIVEILGQTAFGKGIEIGCAIDPGVPARLLGDPLRLRQILINLVGNAVKFTAKGEVSLSIYLEKRFDSYAQLRFEVCDTGVGIPLESQRKIFEAFAQADEGTSRKFGGTGLGLSIAKQLVNLMGGDLCVQSQAGVGSRFWFTIRQNLHEEQPDVPALPSVLKDCTILIADTSPIALRGLQNRLFLLSCRPSTANTMKAALELIESQANLGMPYRALCISSRLSGGSMAEVAAQVEQLSKGATKTIVVAPICDQRPLSELASARRIILLDKPVQLAKLSQGIAQLLQPVSGNADAETVPPGAVETAVETIDAPLDALPKTVAPPETKAHILVAEDNPVNAEVTRGMLISRHYEVTIATDGLEAFNAFQENPYDLILMDGQMPNMDGLESTLTIREYEERNNLPRIPIVACTANIVDGLREQYLREGMDDFISKPFSREQLISIVQKWLPEEQLKARREKTGLIAAQKEAAKEVAVAIEAAAPLPTKLSDAIKREIPEERDVATEPLSSDAGHAWPLETMQTSETADSLNAGTAKVASVATKASPAAAPISIVRSPSAAASLPSLRKANTRLSVTGYGNSSQTPSANTTETPVDRTVITAKTSRSLTSTASLKRQDALDTNALKRIVNIDPDNGVEFLQNIITIYVQDTQLTLEQMQRAVNRLDFESLKKLAHKVKSSSANIGAINLSQQAYSIEVNPASSDIDLRLTNLQQEYQAVQEELTSLNLKAL